MRFFTLIFVFLVMGAIDIASQTDSSVVYVDSKPRWKTVYDNDNVFFYDVDSTGVRHLRAKWEHTDTSRYYYRVDTINGIDTLVLTYKNIWTSDTRYSYWVDSLGVDELTSTTYYYGDVPTIDKVPIIGTNITIAEHNGLIRVGASLPIISVVVYNLEGIRIYEAYPLKKKYNFRLNPGVIVIEVKTEVDKSINKLIVN